MRSLDFSVFAERPVRLKADRFAGHDTLKVIEKRAHEGGFDTMATIYGAVPTGQAEILHRAVDAFNAVMAEADAPVARPPVTPLSNFAAGMLGGLPAAAE